MPRWLLAAILMVSASGVMFGLDWRPVPEPHYLPATHVAVVNHSLPPSPAATEAVSPPIVAAVPATAPVTTAKPAEPAKIVAGAQPIPPAAEFKPASPAPSTLNPSPVAAGLPPAVDPPPPAAVTDASAPSADIAAAEPAPKCDVRACAAAYFTFRAADCTYQPSNGERRFCDKGHPQRAAMPDDARKAQASACNVDACRQAYFSFNAVDCTYQPSNGARRLCTK